MADKIVVFDAGHGINTAGKRTPDGEREWTFNNKVTLSAIKQLNTYAGVKVYRTDDPTGKTDVSLTARTNKANKLGANVLVSIHHNANTGKWGTWTGTETYTYLGKWADAEKLAKIVQGRLVKAYGLRDRGTKKKDLHMLRESKMTAILTEGGYMDSTIDIKKLRDGKVLEKAGIAIADGVAEFLGLKKKAVTSPSKPSNPTTTNLYRVRKTWADDKSQIGAFADKQNAIDLAKSKSGYKVFDKNGKQVYPVTSTSTPIQKKELYRVRKTWKDEKTQAGAFSDLVNAKALANQKVKDGYKVFDSNGKVVYTPKQPSVTHTVKKGETLWSISQKYGVKVDAIKKDNGLKSDVISIGQKLTIKDSDTPKQNDTGKDGENKEQKPQEKEEINKDSGSEKEDDKNGNREDHSGHHSIIGKSFVKASKMAEFVKVKNPYAKDIDEIAKAFISVGDKYGVRGDIAFCQSIIETGWFKFDGGTAVTYDQHNYCGLGVTQIGLKGNAFETIEDGVTAQIQHLFAYASKEDIPDGEALLDPRFKYVTRGIAPHWEDLNMRWAMNDNYGQHILSIYEQLNNFEYTDEDEQFKFWTKVIDYLIEQLSKLFGIKK